MASAQDIILLFTKYPRPGSSKTRLIPVLGPAGAARLQRMMARSVLFEILRFSRHHPCRTVICHEGGTPQDMRDWLGPCTYRPQDTGDLGRRMFQAIVDHLPTARAILLVGSDCPAIDAGIFAEAFDALRHTHVVIGPAFDGGYYLIGVQGGLSPDRLHPLFTDIAWGGSDVLERTIAAIDKQHLNHQLLKKLHDIDTADDLRHLRHRSDV